MHVNAADAVLHSWDNGNAIKAPQGIAVDAAGNVYVSNTNANPVRSSPRPAPSWPRWRAWYG